MQKFDDVVVHTNWPGEDGLIYHKSVMVPHIVSLVIDFNDLDVVGRATLRWEDDDLLANLYIDKDVADLADPSLAMVATTGTTVFRSEDGNNYAMDGLISQVSLLTEECISTMSSQVVPEMDGLLREAA